jgi:hypothetical protein
MATQDEHTIRPLPFGVKIGPEHFADGKIWRAINPSEMGYVNPEIKVASYKSDDARDKGWSLACRTNQTSEIFYSFLIYDSHLRANYYSPEEEGNLVDLMACHRSDRVSRSAEMFDLV